jgi:hypothetical protein
VIHLDNGWDWSTQEWFYSSVLKQGPLSTSDFDMMGVSFYPVSPKVAVKTMSSTDKLLSSSKAIEPFSKEGWTLSFQSSIMALAVM